MLKLKQSNPNFMKPLPDKSKVEKFGILKTDICSLDMHAMASITFYVLIKASTGRRKTRAFVKIVVRKLDCIIFLNEKRNLRLFHRLQKDDELFWQKFRIEEEHTQFSLWPTVPTAPVPTLPCTVELRLSNSHDPG
jgi:hypothetical protein